ncbi:hypothetical protein RUM43_002710 [Polyplax serrata]|uniref:GOST seven transmembrane domain-containing protein n=1 Tax=Polyplax serrata TaxID=468196 RepID=A0AAN8PZV9_POLSC
MNLLGITFCLLVHYASARIHKLEIVNDTRKYIPLSTFGFYAGGILSVNLKEFQNVPFREDDLFGFSLDKTLRYVMNPYLEHHQDKCILDEWKYNENSRGRGYKNSIYFLMDFKEKMLIVQGKNLNSVGIFRNEDELRNATYGQDTYPGILPSNKFNMNIFHGNSKEGHVSIPLSLKSHVTSAEFIVYIPSDTSQGLYNLYFHNCPNYKADAPVKIDFKIEIEEVNKDNYLSAGEMPLSGLYSMMSLIFGLSGSFWVYILVKSNLKGSVLFTVILLIGTGWTFIRRGDVLSEKHKKIFMIVLPLQVLANIAKIIIDESEEGDAEQQTWWDIFILVDILCCGAIMFPVVWTIKHLQEASYTDGKAAMNLRKLKLFRHFYIMIITVPFQYEWLDEMFREVATFVCFVLTGYKFRPASENPYYQVPSEEDDIETCVILRDENLPEGLKKVNKCDVDVTPTETTKMCADYES